jgi:hypothetical protein
MAVAGIINQQLSPLFSTLVGQESSHDLAEVLVGKVLVDLGFETEIPKHHGDFIDISGGPLQTAPMLIFTITDEECIGVRVQLKGFVIPADSFDSSLRIALMEVCPVEHTRSRQDSSNSSVKY